MRPIASKIYLEFRELTTLGVPENTLLSGTKRYRDGLSNAWANIADPLDGRCRLIDVDSIPPATVRKYGLPSKAQYLAAHKAEQQQLRAAELSLAGSALNQLHARTVVPTDYNFFFTKGGLTNTKETIEQKAAQLTEAAGWLRLLVGLETRAQLQALGFQKKEQVREAVLAELVQANLYGLRVSHVRVLQTKELAFAKALQLTEEDLQQPISTFERQQLATERALMSLVPDRAGRQNARKIGRKDPEVTGVLALTGRVDLAEWHARTIVMLFMNPGSGNKFDLKEVYRRYQRKCAEAGRSPVSPSGMKGFLDLPEVRMHTAWERHGHVRLEDYLPHVKRDRPSYSLSKGGYDGFSVDFRTQVGNAQVMLTVVAVFDFHSEAITGYSVGLVENGRLVRDMYRNHLKQMGGRSYIELESDRFAGNVSNDTKAMFSRACQILTQPAPNDPRKKASNPKSRFAERCLPELNRLTQSVEGWKGTNITAIDPNRKANPDYAGTEVQPTLEAGILQIAKLVALYNNQKLEKYSNKSRWEVLMADVNPEAEVLDALTQATLLSQHTVTAVRNATVSITVNKKKYDFPFPTYAKHTHKMGKGMKVRVYYDETDLREVTVFGFTDAKDTGTDVFLSTLSMVKRVQMAKTEQTHADLVALAEQQQWRENLREELDRKQLEVEAEQYGLDIPGGLNLKALRAMVMGARLQKKAELVETFDVRHADVLGTPEAQAQVAFYEEVLLRDQNMKVPAPAKATAPAGKKVLTTAERYKRHQGGNYDFS